MYPRKKEIRENERIKCRVTIVTSFKDGTCDEL